MENLIITIIEEMDAFSEFELEAIVGGYDPFDQCNRFRCGTNLCIEYTCTTVSSSCIEYECGVVTCHKVTCISNE